MAPGSLKRIECIDVGAWLDLTRELPECAGVQQLGTSERDRCSCDLRRAVLPVRDAANTVEYPRGWWHR